MQKLITTRMFVLREKDRFLKLNKNAFKGNTSYLKQYKKVLTDNLPKLTKFQYAQEEFKSSTASGKYVTRALSGVRNKLMKAEASLESQNIFIAWVLNLQEGKEKIKDYSKFFDSIEIAATYLNNKNSST